MAVRAPIFHPPQSPDKQNFLFPHNCAMSLCSNRVFMRAYIIARFLLFLALCLVESTARQRVLAGELSREANSTLALSLEPYRYTTLDAFPGLSFDDPAAMVSPPGDSNRLFIVERSGRIQVITNLNSPNKTLFLDISARVNPGGEGGLLGLAFPPGHPTNRYFFLFYTLHTITAAGSGFHDRLARFEISPTDPNAVLPDSEVPLITQSDEAANHNGGDLHFGPDGYLYVSLGDEGGAGGEFGNTQRIDKDFFSGILRIDVDQRAGSLSPNPHPASSTNYTVPADNPFVGATSFNGGTVDPNQVRTEFWAVGLRNPWRFSFDSLTGRLYCGDVGQDSREEIDLIISGSGAIHRLVLQDDVEKELPATLDATGAFADLATLQPQPGIVPYDVNVPFWSDHARKTRWFAVPDTGQFMSFSPNENWAFP